MVIALLYNACRFPETMASAIPRVLPTLPREFIWTDQPWGAVLQCVPIAAVAVHGWTTRQLAITGGPGSCDAQWQQLAQAGAVTRAGIVAVHQVHGTEVVNAREVGQMVSRQADGLVSSDPSLMLTVRVADCVPLLICDRRLGVVAAVHAGWRGSAAGIAGAAVSGLQDQYGSRAGDLVAALGPSIGPCCYSVGEELVDAFKKNGHRASRVDRWFLRGRGLRLDLWRANREQLETAGIPASAVLVSCLCTACHPEWFCSYRREGSAAGRLVGFIRAVNR
jgi:polyphenol oxidase